MFDYAKRYAHKKSDTPDTTFQKQLLAIISSFLVLCGAAWFIMGYQIFGMTIPAISAGLFGLMVLAMLIISHKKKNQYYLIHPLFVGVILVPILWQWSIGSFHLSGMVIAWSFLTPLGILIFHSARLAVFYMIVFLSAIIITIFFEPTFYGTPLEVAAGHINLFYTMNLATSFTVIFATSAWFVHTIKVEKHHSEELLLNILPRDVAEELQITGETQAKAFTMVTVMFTDFVGFSQVSKKVSAELLVDEIHHCFSGFDHIISKYHIEKIKTIGDSYLCTSGLPVSNYTHAVDMINAAFEIRRFIHERKKEKEARGEIPFELRIGIHTGPVVAGIVGVRKFQYDIWGDTVNTANRIENAGKSAKVNISQSTYDLVKDNSDFMFENRGKIEVKGKGELEMYFVEKA